MAKRKQKKNEFKMEVKNSTDSKAELYLFGEIVSSEWDRWELEDIAPEGVKNLLDEIGDKDLDIFVNSGGGSVFAGQAIYNMLKRHKGFKTVYVDGVAASIASVIALAGDRVIIPTNAYFMIHKPYMGMVGNSTEMRKAANDLDRIEEGILNIYEQHLQDGVDMATIKTMMTKETWMTGKEAQKYFNIEVGDSSEAVALVDDAFQNYANTPQELIEEENSADETEVEETETEGLTVTVTLPENVNELIEEAAMKVIVENMQVGKPKQKEENENEIKLAEEILALQIQLNIL